jgi:hypothetical protein
MQLLKKVMPKMLLLIAIIFYTNGTPQENFWHVLSEVSYAKSKDENGYEVEKPLFSGKLKSYDGRKITLKGYIVPMNEVNGKPTMMLSSLPFNVCYFCGGAGPETVVEVETSQQIKFTTKQIRLEGILLLNDTDPDHHMYIIKSASLIH